MEFKQLEMFVAVAEERSVIRAAERVYRTQPAVTMAVQKLEEEIGSSLFDRARRFELTAAGRLLCKYAKRMLALRDEAARLVAERLRTRADRRAGRPTMAGGTPALQEDTT